MLSSALKKQLVKLKQKKYRKQFAEYIVEGRKGVTEALLHAEVLAVVIDGVRRDEDEFKIIVDQCESKEIVVEYAKSTEIDTIKATDTFPGVLAVVERPETDIYNIDISGPVIALDRVNDPGNLGTIIRTANWFGINTVLVGEGSVDPFNEKTVRSTMGSIFKTTIVETKELKQSLENLKQEGYQINSFDMKGESINKLEKSQDKQVLLFGSESHGISDDLKALIDTTFTIDKFGNAESLNLAISAGIVMYQLKM